MTSSICETRPIEYESPLKDSPKCVMPQRSVVTTASTACHILAAVTLQHSQRQQPHHDIVRLASSNGVDCCAACVNDACHLFWLLCGGQQRERPSTLWWVPTGRTDAGGAIGETNKNSKRNMLVVQTFHSALSTAWWGPTGSHTGTHAQIPSYSVRLVMLVVAFISSGATSVLNQIGE